MKTAHWQMKTEASSARPNKRINLTRLGRRTMAGDRRAGYAPNVMADIFVVAGSAKRQIEGAVRTCCLRSVFDLSGMGFSDEALLLSGATSARLVKASTMMVWEDVRVTGLSPDGQVQVSGRTFDKTFEGRPLLLEIRATAATDESAIATTLRPQLEAQTSQVEALVSWALPNVVGPRLADSLYTRVNADPPNTWQWLEVSRFSPSDYYQASGAVVARCVEVDAALRALPEDRRDAAATGLRWWRYSRHLESPVDQVVALWVSIEAAATVLGTGDSIRQRVLSTLCLVFGAPSGGDRQLKKLRDVLYDSRCATVHSGMRDLKDRDVVLSLAESSASACLRYLIEGTVSQLPHLMSSFAAKPSAGAITSASRCHSDP